MTLSQKVYDENYWKVRPFVSVMIVMLTYLEEEKEEVIPDVDDTDGVDPTGEFEAWRLRELGRIKKEKEDELRREEEREEIERRRALPEEQRLKEDLERANKLREEKPKGQQKFLQKYWHKGAFHQVCHTSFICVILSFYTCIRMRQSSHDTTTQKQLSLRWMSRCYPKSCGSRTSVNAVEPSIPILWIRTQRKGVEVLEGPVL
jgi:hypothetical protein